MAFGMKSIIGIALGIYVLAAILPGAFDNFFGADTSGWDDGTAALWLLIPLAVVVTIVIRYFDYGEGSGA